MSRVGNFTSSQIYRLMANGKAKYSIGKPFYTYVQEKVREIRTGRPVNAYSSSRATEWGNFMEGWVFSEKLGLEYSLVSNEYKERLRITQNRVPILDNELSNSIVKYNIPLSITIKARHLKQELMDLLEVGDTMFERELYSMFDKNKERWQP